MLQNAYFLAKIGADTAENEQHFAENLPKNGNYLTTLTMPAAVAWSASRPRRDRGLANPLQATSSQAVVITPKP